MPSVLSQYLRHGMISAAKIARAVRRSGPPADVEALLDQLITWRELSINCCARNPSYATFAALPDWVHRSML